jgi:hypothetical protein
LFARATIHKNRDDARLPPPAGTPGRPLVHGVERRGGHHDRVGRRQLISFMWHPEVCPYPVTSQCLQSIGVDEPPAQRRRDYPDQPALLPRQTDEIANGRCIWRSAHNRIQDTSRTAGSAHDWRAYL